MTMKSDDMPRRTSPDAGGHRPNILFILTDDQGPWALGCAGNPEVRTPNLDRLAASGMRFENFFCASPVCSPARATLLTGRIPSRHGVHDWLRAGNTIARYEPQRGGKLIEYLEGQPGYTDVLSNAGYVCGLSGKWHLGDAHHPQKGFSYWRVHAKGGGPYYNAPMVRGDEVYEEPGYVTDVITDNALTFLEERRAGCKPFYLGVHYTAPHSPWERKHHPVEIYDDYHENCAFSSVPDDLPPPAWAEELRIPVRDSARRREILSGYYAAVTAMDAGVGRLLDRLESSGLLESTLVVFSSDNGMNMGHHGVFGKGNATFPLNMFEESVKVPLIASHPGSVPGGVVSDALWSQYDMLPTLLDYAGIDGPEDPDLPGRSLGRLLRGEPFDAHEEIVVFDEYGPVRMVRTPRWKYVHRYPYGPHELYDLGDDPGETRNLVDEERHASRVAEMRGRLEAWFRRYADPRCDGLREAITGSGQIGVVGDAAGGAPRFIDRAGRPG